MIAASAERCFALALTIGGPPAADASGDAAASVLLPCSGTASQPSRMTTRRATFTPLARRRNILSRYGKAKDKKNLTVNRLAKRLVALTKTVGAMSSAPSKQMAWGALFPAYSDASRIGQPRSYDPLLARYSRMSLLRQSLMATVQQPRLTDSELVPRDAGWAQGQALPAHRGVVGPQRFSPPRAPRLRTNQGRCRASGSREHGGLPSTQGYRGQGVGKVTCCQNGKVTSYIPATALPCDVDHPLSVHTRFTQTLSTQAIH